MPVGIAGGDPRQPEGRREVEGATGSGGCQEVGEGRSGGGRTQRTVLLSLPFCLGQNHPSCLAYRNKVY